MFYLVMAHIFQHLKQFYSGNKVFKYMITGTVPYFFVLNSFRAQEELDKYEKDLVSFDLERSYDDMTKRIVINFNKNFNNTIIESAVWPIHLTMIIFFNGMIAIHKNHLPENKDMSRKD